MPGTKYRCHRCQETFEVPGPHDPKKLTCPRCFSKRVEKPQTCDLGITAPPWEYTCLNCQTRFYVESPKGPDEAREIKCPVCGSGNIKWHFTVYECVPTGG